VTYPERLISIDTTQPRGSQFPTEVVTEGTYVWGGGRDTGADVIVVTGAEARPNTTGVVVWYDWRGAASLSPPLNMADFDVWWAFAVGPPTAPDILTTTLGWLAVGTAASRELFADGSPGVWTVTAGAVPSGMTFNPTTHMVAGTPTVTGEVYTFTVTLTNTEGSDTQTYTGTVVPALTGTLLGEWGFARDNLDDTSGNGHTAAVTLGVVGYTDGPQPGTRALAFDTVATTVSLGRTGLEPTTEGVSTMCWVRATGLTEGEPGLLHKMAAPNSTQNMLRLVAHSPSPYSGAYVARWKNDLNFDADAPGTWTDAQWHHLALVDGNHGWAYYVDGVLKANGSRSFDTTPYTWANFPWEIGRSSNATDIDGGDGDLMQQSGFRIFGGELTASDINYWMNTPIT
jgi:Concanavalin A-like lectin/glucanases superfamily/Putative Ig domain